MDFLDVESWRHPGVFLQGATRIIVGSRVVVLRELGQKLSVHVVQYVPRQVALFFRGGFDVVVFPRAFAMTTKFSPVVGFEPGTLVATVQAKLADAFVQVVARALTVIHVVDCVIELGRYRGSGEGG